MYIAKLEIEHAKAILKSRDPWEALKNFAYLPNYLQLARTEYQGSRVKPGERVLFLGSCWTPFIVMNYRHNLRNISGYDQNRLPTIPWFF
ncbi:MAG: nicotianamine synthase family protein [Halobacteriota archaeon]